MVPSSVGHTAVAAVAALYAQIAVELPAQGAMRYWLSIASITTVWVIVGEWLSLRGLRTLSALENPGRAAGQVPHHLEVAAEVLDFPAHNARVGLGVWGGAVVTLALVLRLVDGWPLASCGQIVLLGVLFGPMAVALVRLLVARRMHSIVEALTGDGSPEGVVGPLAQSDTRSRITGLTLVMVALPAFMVIDVSQRVTDRLLRGLARAAEGPAREALAVAARDELLMTTVGLALLTLALALMAAWAGAALIAEPLQRLVGEAERVGQGKIGDATFISAAGEGGRVTAAFGRLRRRLVEVVTQLRRAGQSLHMAVMSFRTVAERSAQRLADEAAAVDQTTATTSTLAQSARQVSQRAAAVSRLARQTLDAVESGRGQADAFAAAIERMRGDHAAVTAAIDRLRERVLQIGTVLEVISRVADRSALLALSAELEGTHAGDAGRGFVQVAAEMRRVAETVAESAAEVEALVFEVRERTERTVAAASGGAAVAEQATERALHITRALEQVRSSANETMAQVRAIGLATQQQETGTQQLAEVMGDIFEVSQRALSTTAAVKKAQVDLQAAADRLGQAVAHFE